MSEQKEAPVLEHEADGITELDNQLPRWWVWLFWGCIFYGILYLLHFHVFRMGKLSGAQYQQEVAAEDARKLAAAGGAAAAGAEQEIPLDQVQPSTETAVLARGKALFDKNCVMCHGPQGQGLVGPNLCDEYWIHGPAFADSVRTIREGVPAKGMITWKTQMKPSEIMAVASHIYTLRGTTPPNPKAAEGVKAEPQPAPAPAPAAAPAAEPAAAPAPAAAPSAG